MRGASQVEPPREGSKSGGVVAVVTSGGQNVGWVQPHHLLLEVVSGLRDALQQEGTVPALVGETDPDLATLLASPSFAGVVALSQLKSATCEAIRKSGQPTLWVDGPVWEPQRCIRRDEVRAGQMVAHVAVSGGCSRVLFLAASSTSAASRHYSHAQRMGGVRLTVERCGLAMEVVEIEDQWDPGPMQLVMSTYTPTTAVICSNFYIADWLTAYVLAAGSSATQIPLFSCDDARKPLLHMLRLTRAGFDRYGMGVAAGRMMLRALREPGAPCPSELLEPSIIPYNVTPPPTGDSLAQDDPLAPPEPAVTARP